MIDNAQPGKVLLIETAHNCLPTLANFINTVYNWCNLYAFVDRVISSTNKKYRNSNTLYCNIIATVIAVLQL